MASFEVLPAALALLVLVAACGDDDADQAGATSTTAPETTTTARDTTTTPPPGEAERCENPEGFAVTPPEGWFANDGDVVAECSQWSPEPFVVPEATDERVAAVTAYVDPVPYAEAATIDAAAEGDRAVTSVDGRQAVRLSYEAGGDGLRPAGTPITLYAVDFTAIDGEPATLFLDAVGNEPVDHDTAVRALDRMVTTLDVTASGIEDDPSLVATYLGGGGGFSVTAEHLDGETCLRIPPDGEEVCTDDPAADQVHTISLEDLGGDRLAGVTGEDVWRVDAVGHGGGTTHSYLAAPVPGSELGAFALTVGLDAVEQLVLLDITGEEIRAVTPGG